MPEAKKAGPSDSPGTGQALGFRLSRDRPGPGVLFVSPGVHAWEGKAEGTTARPSGLFGVRPSGLGAARKAFRPSHPRPEGLTGGLASLFPGVNAWANEPDEHTGQHYFASFR